MPLNIKVHTVDGEIMYDGPGTLDFSNGPVGAEIVLRAEVNGYRCTVDLSHFVREGWRYILRPVMNDQVIWPVLVRDLDDQFKVPFPEQNGWDLELDIPNGLARAWREELERSHPGYAVAPRAEFTADMVREAMERIRASYLTRDQIRAAFNLPEEIIGPDPALDELIDSTRSEFPYDPLGYGRVYPDGPSRWTPPDDPDEKLRSCP